MVSEKRTGSCGTYPIAPRSTASGICRTSMPSTNTVPGGGSYSRGSRLTNVDFPDPVAPTIASVWPGSIVTDTRSRTGRPLYAKLRFRNSTRPRTSTGCRGAAGADASLTEGSTSSTSSIRCHDAMPRCSMFVTQPKAIIGQLNMTR